MKKFSFSLKKGKLFFLSRSNVLVAKLEKAAGSKSVLCRFESYQGHEKKKFVRFESIKTHKLKTITAMSSNWIRQEITDLQIRVRVLAWLLKLRK